MAKSLGRTSGIPLFRTFDSISVVTHTSAHLLYHCISIEEKEKNKHIQPVTSIKRWCVHYETRYPQSVPITIGHVAKHRRWSNLKFQSIELSRRDLKLFSLLFLAFSLQGALAKFTGWGMQHVLRQDPDDDAGYRRSIRHMA